VHLFAKDMRLLRTIAIFSLVFTAYGTIEGLPPVLSCLSLMLLNIVRLAEVVGATRSASDATNRP
jgi:hypothetical protein